MQLNDSLQVCLLSLISRYPKHMLDINEMVLGSQDFDAHNLFATDLIEGLEQNAPYLLGARARLIIDPQKSEIYLLEYSEHSPAVFIHCRGKPPSNKTTINLVQIHVPREAPFSEYSIMG